MRHSGRRRKRQAFAPASAEASRSVGKKKEVRFAGSIARQEPCKKRSPAPVSASEVRRQNKGKERVCLRGGATHRKDRRGDERRLRAGAVPTPRFGRWGPKQTHALGPGPEESHDARRV